MAEKVGWQGDSIEVEEQLYDIKEQQTKDKNMNLEEAQLKSKKKLLKGLIKRVPEALRSVQMLVGLAVSGLSL
jgi:hypothetical protein